MAERAHPDDSGFKNKFFGFKKNPYQEALKNRYNYCNDYIQNKVVIDIPCGTGWGTAMLKGYKKITGIDISEEAIEFAKKRYPLPNVDFTTGSMEKIDMDDNSLDVVICLEGFEHVEKEIGIKFLNEAKRVLKNKGLIIMTSPVLDENGKGSGNPYHLCEYPEKELRELLDKKFNVIKFKKVDGPELPIVYFVGENNK